MIRYQAIKELKSALETLNSESTPDNRITTICYALQQKMEEAMSASKRVRLSIEPLTSNQRINELFTTAQQAFQNEPKLWARIKNLFAEFFIKIRLNLGLINKETAQTEISALKPKSRGEDILNSCVVQSKLSFLNALPKEPPFSYGDDDENHATTSCSW